MAPGAQAAGRASTAQPPPQRGSPPPPLPLRDSLLPLQTPSCSLPSSPATASLLSVFPLLPVLPVGFRTKWPLRPGGAALVTPATLHTLSASPSSLIYSPRQILPLSQRFSRQSLHERPLEGLSQQRPLGLPTGCLHFQVLLSRCTVGYLG